MNLPNKITIARIVLSVLLLVMLIFPSTSEYNTYARRISLIPSETSISGNISIL